MRKIYSVALTAIIAFAASMSAAAFRSDYTWEYYNFGMSGQDTYSQSVRIDITDATTGAAEITGIHPYSTIKCTVDEKAGTLTIANNQYLCRDSYGPIYFFLKRIVESLEGLDFTEGACDDAATVGTIAADGTITFPDELVWAIGDPAAEHMGLNLRPTPNKFKPGYLDGEAPEETHPLDPEENWEDYTTGVFIDPWIVTAYRTADQYMVNPAAYPFEVKVQKSADRPNVYRIQDPYITPGNAVATLNEGNEFQMRCSSGAIVFDVTDPDYVLVLAHYFSGAMLDKPYFCMNTEGWYADVDMGKDYVVEEMGLISVPSSLDATRTRVNFNNCILGMDPTCEEAMTWTGVAEYMNGSLTLAKPLADESGIHAIEATDLPVEYYNLQGVRLANPQPGIVIVRQGQKSYKTVIR